MKIIVQKQKSILILGVVILLSIFFIGRSVSVVYGQTRVVGGIIYSPEGYFAADNGSFGGPGNHTANYSPGYEYVPADYHPEAGCTNCIGGYWTKYDITCCDKDGCWVCGHYYLWTCTLNRLGIMGSYSEDSACKAVYGGSVRASRPFFRNFNVQIDICDYTSTKAYRIDCVVDIPTPPLPPLPTGSSCAKWGTGTQEGVCIGVVTSIFQGDSESGNISTDPAQFIVRILTIILAFSGGIALLLIISSGYKIIMSKGKPEGIQQGRDQLIAAIVGLVFIIFSFVIFQLVVVDIFKIPGIN